ncbi:P-loop containing nucleoside triphosphate hydrolase protein [Schizothecium vesticola]|uniref:P-loop containing nucleoside triphosphate hydrolase protein n=1 Tax=Schizothecium vesticola TaxID=314040 RepID=A0AA40K8V4_9PEZI|nr:P-loop containing nucleoside triphosphate hydrolase protein [Schizothecium vesticola]
MASPSTHDSTLIGSISPKSSFRDLFAFTRRAHLPILTSAFFTAALVAAARTGYAVLTGRIFEIVTRFGAGLITADEYLSEISRWCGYLCLLGLAMWLVASLDMALWITTGELRAKTAREALFGAFLQKTMAWYDARESGTSSLLVGIHTQIRELQLATSQTLGYLVFELFLFIACLTVAFVFSYKLTLVMLATAVPSAVILWFVSRFLDPAIERQKRELATAAQHATAAVTAIDLVKVYNGQDDEAFHFVGAVRRAGRHYARQVLCNCAQMSYIKFWMIVLFVIGFYFAVVLASRGEITPGDALTTFYAVLIAFQSLEALGPQWLIVAKGMAAGQLLKTLAAEGLNDGPDDKVSGLYAPDGCHGDIRLNNVSFAYPSNPSHLVLRPSTMHFPAGRLTFVVGRSGSGKSTLANLLLRFYDPLPGGSLTLDGRPLAHLDLAWLRRTILLVQQSSVLFADTFLRNLAFGAPADIDPDALTPADVREACDLALLQATVAGMPEGVHTLIGPTGYSLSGGQRQRLALARARLRDPPVLVLDEITSGLDPASRGMIMEAVRFWRRGRTTVVITHEVGHIEDENLVYVMEGGRVVQEGEMRELMDEGGLFSELVAAADDATSTSSAARGESEDESEDEKDEDWEDELLRERFGIGRDESMFHKFGLDGEQRATGFFHRMSRPVEPAHPISDLARSRATMRRPSEGEQMDVVTKMGLEVQINRARDGRRTIQEHEAAAVSMDSLEMFFMEKLAKSKDKKASKKNSERPAGPRLPSMKAILKTVWPTLDKTGKVQLILGLASCAVIAASDVLFAFIFAQLLSAFWLPTGREQAGAKWAVFLTIVATVDAAATFAAYFLMEHVAQRWVNALRAEAIRRILAQPKSWFDKPGHTPGRIAQCLDRSAEEMRKLVGMFAPIVLAVTCLISASIIWALIIRWDLTLVTLAGVPIAIATARANSMVSDKWESVCETAVAATSAIFSDAFANIRVVRALTLENYFSAKHSTSCAATHRVGIKRAVFAGIFYGLYQSMSFFITALVFFYGAKLLSQGQTTVTDVLRVINLVLFSLGTSVAMLANLPQIAAAKVTAVQLLHYAHLSYAASHEYKGTGRIPTPLPVSMTNLQFAYPGAPRTQVLRNITLDIVPGTATAIVGASGCGKSTIMALLLQLYDPTPTTPGNDGGAPAQAPLTFAHTPPSELSISSLRSHIAYVPQHPFLFPISVRENIAYGLHDASPYREPMHIETAARRAGIHDFVVSLPGGYDTLVGDGGLSVSGGQAQRLALARALVRRPKLLMLDEPTSALDAAGAEEVRRLVRGLCEREGTAVVVVTHSKEMMRVVDRAVMVEAGSVVESGRYEDLVVMGGPFAAMVGGGAWMGSGGKAKERGASGTREKKRDKAREDALKRLEGEASGRGARKL